MPLVISDETLQLSGLTELEMRLELACHLFDSGKLPIWPAAQMAGLSRNEFEAALHQRGIAPYRMDEIYVRQEMNYIAQTDSGRDTP